MWKKKKKKKIFRHKNVSKRYPTIFRNSKMWVLNILSIQMKKCYPQKLDGLKAPWGDLSWPEANKWMILAS